MKHNLMNLHAVIVHGAKCPEKVADKVRDEAAHQLKKENQADLTHSNLVDVVKGTKAALCGGHQQPPAGTQNWACVAKVVCGKDVTKVVDGLIKGIKEDGLKQTPSGLHGYLVHKLQCPENTADAARENAANINGLNLKHDEHIPTAELHNLIHATGEKLCKK
jgi:hypothetical protein